MEVSFNIPENRIKDFSVGKNVSVSFWALGKMNVTAAVREVAAVADPTTRTYKVTVTLPSDVPGVQLGMTATVTDNKAPLRTVNPSVAVRIVSYRYRLSIRPEIRLKCGLSVRTILFLCKT